LQVIDNFSSGVLNGIWHEHKTKAFMIEIVLGLTNMLDSQNYDRVQKEKQSGQNGPK